MPRESPLQPNFREPELTSGCTRHVMVGAHPTGSAHTEPLPAHGRALPVAAVASSSRACICPGWARTPFAPEGIPGLRLRTLPPAGVVHGSARCTRLSGDTPSLSWIGRVP